MIPVRRLRFRLGGKQSKRRDLPLTPQSSVRGSDAPCKSDPFRYTAADGTVPSPLSTGGRSKMRRLGSLAVLMLAALTPSFVRAAPPTLDKPGK